MRKLVLFCLSTFLLVSNAFADVSLQETNFDNERWVSRFEAIALTLSGSPSLDEGRIAVFIGDTDYSSMFERQNGRLVYGADDAIPLPSGENELVVYLVRADTDWEEIARVPLNVRDRFGFERATITPQFDANVDSTWDDGRSEDAGEAERESDFHDVTFQTGADAELVRSGITLRSNVAIVGTSFQEQALRFAEEEGDAPKVDLSNYLFEAEGHGLRLEWGHVSYGTHPFLMDGMSSRGVTAQYDHEGMFDVSAGIIRGTEIVGWDDFIGFGDSDNQIFGTTLGLNVLEITRRLTDLDLSTESRQPSLRAEVSFLDGTIPNELGFEVGEVGESQEGTGVGVHVKLDDLPGGFRGEYIFASSETSNPNADVLEQDQQIVEIEETRNQASRYVAAWDILQSHEVSEGRTISVLADASYEEIDPEFQSLGAFPTADIELYTINGSIDLFGLSLQGQYSDSEDNIDDIPAILKTKTKTTSASLSAPIALLVDPFDDGTSWYLPELTYSYNRTRQTGDDGVLAIPESGFDDPSQIPAQVLQAHDLQVNFASTYVDFGYAFAYSFENNKQVGRENADFKSYDNRVFATIRPGVDWATVTGSVGRARQVDISQALTNRTTNYEVNVDVVLPYDIGFTNGFTYTENDDSQDLAESDSYTFQSQVSYQIDLPNLQGTSSPAQLFARYDYQDSSAIDSIFGLDTVVRTWSVTTGLSVSLF